MQEHPVPQDITGYQFHIVGSMTIKQFAEVGAGALLGFIIYTTNLPEIIKWPMVAVAVAAGAGAAFLPIEERPLDHWIITFFKVLYRPTKYFWKREPKIPDPFLYEPQSTKKPQPIEVDLTPARRERIKEFMTSLRHEEVDAYQAYEDQRISSVLNTFSTVTAKEVDIIKQIEKPSLRVRVRELTAPESEPETNEQKLAREYQQVGVKTISSTQNIAQDIDIPEQETIQVARPVSEEEAEETTQPTQTATYMEDQPQSAAIDESQVSQTSYNTDLPFPIMPQEPNRPVGMVLGPNNEILNNTIVEIKSMDGRVARAVKTNSLGQFFITTPLTNGEYIIESEHDDFQFPQIRLTLDGSVVQPVEVRGQSNQTLPSAA